jgi:hypothetical protein
MVRYDGSSGFRFTEGKAFWVIKNGPWSVNTTAPAAPVDSAGNATIALHAGWNLITNPFPSAVSWAAVRTANNVTDPIYSFAGSFNQSADFAPYAGYYFFNTNGLAALKIPNSPPGAASSAVQPAERREWKVNVIMISSEATDRSTWFGISGNAMRGLDPLDFRKPAGLLSGQAISFSRPEWDARYTEFATDMRPGIVDLEEWPFTVRSPGGGETVHLAFAGLRSLPAELDAYLVNDEGTVAQNLRADSVLSFVRQGTRSNFTVLVGTREAMNVRLSGIEPRTFFLGDNYPNPFNPATNLSVGIPTESDVMLAVFDMLGKEVKQLYKGTLKPGEYAFTWDGRDASGTTLPSGTYFSRLVAGRGTILTKKMVLVR